MTTRKFGLEAFKFGVCIALPVSTVLFFNRPDVMERVIRKLRYVEYPAEGPKPATGDLNDVKRALEKRHGKEA